MIRSLFTFLLVLGCATAFSQGFTVENYQVDLYVNEDGYFDVVEKYELEFSQAKHGIYRNIQTTYALLTAEGKKENRRIGISKIEVPGHRSEHTNRFARRIGGQLTIKIGDPNKTVIGAQRYEIGYRVTNAFLYEATATRLYWNLKPTGWYAPFNDMTFRVHLPENVQVDMQDVNVYSGYTGNTTPSDAFEMDYKNGVITGIAKQGFVSNYGEAVTILVNLPVNSVKEIKPLWPFWTRYGWTLLIAALFAGFFYLFRKYGKDDKVPTAISYFPPENMDPAMAGFLINDRQDTSDLISLIPYWGTRGLIRIEEIDKKGWFAKDDTKIIKLKDLPKDAPDYERSIFNGLFTGSSTEVMVSSLRNSFYTTMSTAKSKLTKAAQRYYEPKSRAVRKVVTGGLIVLLLLLGPIVLYVWGIPALAALILSCVILFVLNIFMIKKNTRGNKVFSELKGFRKFIRTAEENKLKMLLAESPVYFESTMAYALTFGSFDAWVRKFGDLNVQPPEWYSGTGGHYSSMNNFSRSFSNTMSSASSTMVSSPSSSSSGGGSSGGGFGGGGGGSW